jgi:glycosyltransferase involved in cell wall biosynthesis
VVPSRKEPWGLVVNESLGLGRFVIASDRVGAAMDLIRPGVGRTFRAGDPASLAEELVWFFGHGPRRIEPMPQTDPAKSMAMAMLVLAEDGR